MRLVLSAAVLALWTSDTPNSTANAFSIQGPPRLGSRPRISGLSAPSSLYMSTMERPMTAPNSPNSAGHPFGAYGKPSPQDGNKDDRSYSYGPNKNSDNNERMAPVDSFEAYMRGRNREGNPPSNPPTPSDNYFARQQQQSAPASNFGTPSTPAKMNNHNSNFGAPPSAPSTPTGTNNNNSFSSFAMGGNARSTPPPPPPATPTGTNSNNSFSSFATQGNSPSTPPPATSNYGAPSSPQTPPGNNNNNSFASFATRGNPSTPPRTPPPSNFGAPSTPQQGNSPSTPPPATSNYGAPSSPQTPPGNNNNKSFASFATRGSPSTPPRTPPPSNFGAPFTPQSSPAAQTPNSFANFATGGSPSTPPKPTPGSFEDYMNSQRSNSSSGQPQSPPAGGSPFPPSTGNQDRIASTVAAAADPNSPLPPYMSPASLEDASIKSANLPGATTFREQDTSMRNQIAPPLSAPLARVGTPAGQLNIGTPSEELVGRLDQVLHKQREFEDRLDKVDEKIDRTTQENILRTQSMLNDFREDNKKTQETFMNRMNTEVRGMQSTMDKILNEQKEVKEKQENQTTKFANLEKARSEQSEKLLTLEKTTSIRAQNLERNTNQAAVNQAQRLEALERNAGAGSQPASGGSGTFQLEQQQNARMAAFEQAQLERMAAFEDEQRQQLESALREHREMSQQQKNTNNVNGAVGNNSNNANSINNPEYQQEQARLDETERQLQERLEEAQNRKEELMQQLEEMQRQEEMYINNGNGRGSHEDPYSARGGPSTTPSRFDGKQQQRDDFDGSKENPPHFEDKEADEEQPRRRMMRDRLGKTSGEELYQPSGGDRRGPNNFGDEKDFDDRMDNRMTNMDPEEDRRIQHERMMRRDPISPPTAMGARSQQGRNMQRPGSPAGRYDPRRGGPSNDMDDELAYGISEDAGVHKTLGNMRSFKGDEQLPNKSLFDESGSSSMGGTMGMGRRGSQQTGRRVPAGQADRGMRQQQQPQQRSGPKQRRAGLSESPPPNPTVDKKLEHFLKESLMNGPQSHFDKEMESLLMIKYSPLFNWLKPANMAFLRNVLVTYLQHKGCQVEMDLSSASPKAVREWDDLLDILSFELQQRTGEEPRIMEEPNNQWGIYGSKNVRLKIANNDGPKSQRRRGGGVGVTREEAARRKRRNDKAFIVSTDPTDPTTRLL